MARIADWRIPDWSSRARDVAPSDPLKPRFRWQIRNLRGRWRRMHPWGARLANFEAFLGPHSSRFERLKRFRAFECADRGLGQIA
eukprot:3793061-Alexandrium_andersonii.AAC.1